MKNNETFQADPTFPIEKSRPHINFDPNLKCYRSPVGTEQKRKENSRCNSTTCR